MKRKVFLTSLIDGGQRPLIWRCLSNQVRLFIRNLPCTYRYLRFMPLENFMTLTKVGMLVEEEFLQKRARDQPNSGVYIDT